LLNEGACFVVISVNKAKISTFNATCAIMIGSNVCEYRAGVIFV